MRTCTSSLNNNSNVFTYARICYLLFSCCLFFTAQATGVQIPTGVEISNPALRPTQFSAECTRCAFSLGSKAAGLSTVSFIPSIKTMG
jgi:hypothetical protein